MKKWVVFYTSYDFDEKHNKVRCLGTSSITQSSDGRWSTRRLVNEVYIGVNIRRHPQAKFFAVAIGPDVFNLRLITDYYKL